MSFREISGHRQIVTLLSRAIERDALPPSLIFAGLAGIGKRLVAVSVAQALNCSDLRRSSDAADGIVLDSCGVCRACRRVARGVHPDVITIQPGDSGAIKVERAREIVDRAAFRPFEGRRRVVIVDDAECLVPAAQNALLKTLEEPPSSSVFVLLTSLPDALLATVRSRCQRFRFQPLDAPSVAAVLSRLGRTGDEARALAAVAEGSVGRALYGQTSELVDARKAAAWVLAEAATDANPRRRLEAAKELVVKGGGGKSDRDALALGLHAMASLIRDVELLSVTADVRALANADLQPAIERLSGFQGDRGLRAFRAINDALSALDRNASAKIVADWVVLQL